MNKPIDTTLVEIREHYPCAPGWEILLKHLGKTKADDEPLDLLTILDSNGLADCLWCARSTHGHDRLWRLYVVWCVRQVQHLMTDDRSIAALDVAERFANGDATAAELAAARVTARAVSWARAGAAMAWAAGAAAGVTSWAIEDATEAVWAAARAASWATARSTARATGADWATARAAQEAKLRQILTAGEYDAK